MRLKLFFVQCQVLLLICVNGISATLLDGLKSSYSCVHESLVKRHNLNPIIYRECDQLKSNGTSFRYKRRVDTTFRGNPKPYGEVLANKFHMDLYNFDQTNSLVKLVNKIALEYLVKCPPVIYYDSFVQKSEGLILENLFKTFPLTFYHGEINERYEALNSRLTQRIDSNCKSYILFLSDPLMTRKVLGSQSESRVVLIARSSQWKLKDFLASGLSSNIVNLLVVGESLMADPMKERPYVLYTHKLYTDGLGSNIPIVLTSWIKGALSRPHINLFPKKFQEGFAGHSFTVSASNQPPFIFRIRTLDSGGTTSISWEGIEYRLLNMISKKLNFTMDILETPKKTEYKSIVDNIQIEIAKKAADIGMSGVFITEDRIYDTDMSVGHSRDCAAFITLASKALPKYRAIMGPFQWPVWLALILVYLGAIFPIVFTDRLTLSHLIGNWGEIENMFWYVFGMFTNSFTFSGKYSWSSSKRLSTRLLIGFYWMFTIIITSCYTSSIISFVTLPTFPDTIDSANELLGLFFRVGTLDNGGWERWFQNSTHEATSKLYKKMEFVSTINEGIGNVTQSFFWNYAFLGSKAQLEYLVQSNFTDENISHRSALHLSEECFALFQVGYLFPRDAVYKRKIDSMILLAQQSGIINKIKNEVSWQMQRSSSGKLLQASSSNPLRERIQEERQLTAADTEGMFLLMGIGYLIGAIALISEIVGGITNKCRQIIKRSRRKSSAWSSRPSTAPDGVERTEVEQLAHDKRKVDRRKLAENEPKGKKQTFGIKEFNLTRATLKELYGNYYKQEPNYVIKNGKLLLETDTLTTAESTECNSRDTSADIKSITPHLRSKTKKIVVAQVDIEKTSDNIDIDIDIDIDTEIVDAVVVAKHDVDLDVEVNESLAIFDECLERHACDDIAEEQIEKVQEIVISKGSNPFDEDALFGNSTQTTEKEDADVLLHKLNLFHEGQAAITYAKN